MKNLRCPAMIAVIIMLTAVHAFAMKPLTDHQMDFITAGSSDSYNTRNNSSNSLQADRGEIDNSVSVDNSFHAMNIVDSQVEIKSFSSTVGSSNSVATGINVAGFIGRAPGSPTESGNSPDVSGLKTIHQINVFGR